jgi:2-polyprenyl-3-methyl-5-hydroxy-6-metoxy-1,4-benzoquinol methylase
MKNTSVLNIYDEIGNYTMTSQDYFVHMLRFEQMTERMKGKRMLDLGCGKHMNLLKALVQMKHGTAHFEHYIGCDYNKILNWRENYKPLQDKIDLIPNIDWTSEEGYQTVLSIIKQRYGNESYCISCFEVLEHMDFESQKLFIRNLSRLMKETNVEVCYFSTPNFNGSAAKNHISELTAEILEEMLLKYEIKINKTTGLSAWKKFHKTDIFESEETKVIMERLNNELPLPLLKMVWGALLPKEISNNILWELNTTGNDVPDSIEISEENINKRQLEPGTEI